MLYRPLLTLTAASMFMGLVALVLCVILVSGLYRTHTRLQAAATQLAMLDEFERAARAVSRAAAAPGKDLEPALSRLEASREALDERSTALLAPPAAGEAESGPAVTPRPRATIHALLRKARTEWWLSLALAALLAAGTLLLAWQLRHRVLRPLGTLNRLLDAMALGFPAPADALAAHPALDPAIARYNALVHRVSAAEEDRAQHAANVRREVRDATRNLMQQQISLLREQHLAEYGELCARIAHDMRNPLAGILAAVGNLQREARDDEHDARLGLIGDEVMRVSRQLDGLVSTWRQRPEVPTELCLCDAAESVLALSSYHLRPAMELGCDVDPALTLRLPEHGFKQALLILITNAAHAIGRSMVGSISIGSQVTDDHVTITVRDSGPGFSDDALAAGAHALGRHPASGSGLGLAAVRRFVLNQRGQIEIGNVDGRGAFVSLKFPRSLANG
jgi:signal transduction histidine kinase